MREMIRGCVYDTETAEKIAELGWATLMRGEHRYFLHDQANEIVSLCTEQAFNYYQRAVRGIEYLPKRYAVYMDEKAAFGEVEEA